jgi:hypothetical protein
VRSNTSPSEINRRGGALATGWATYHPRVMSSSRPAVTESSCAQNSRAPLTMYGTAEPNVSTMLRSTVSASAIASKLRFKLAYARN